MQNPSISHITFLKSGKDNLKSPRPCLLEKSHLIKINIKKTKLCNIKSTHSTTVDQLKLLDLSRIFQNK